MRKIIVLLALSVGCAVHAQETTTSNTVAAWTAKQEWFGDLRLRGIMLKENLDDQRNYVQLRARLGLRADVNEDVKAVFRLMTATSAISGNQTLGDSSEDDGVKPSSVGMSRRTFGLDWGYMDWKAGEAAHAWIGRTANPFWSPNKSQLIYDADLSFEGLAFKWEPGILGGSESLSKSNAFVNVGAFMVNEYFNSSVSPKRDPVDTALIGGDIGAVIKSSDWSWTTHLGNYYYLNIKDKALINSKSVLGNTAYTTGAAPNLVYHYTNGYALMEVGTEWKQKLEAIEYTLFADWVKNSKASKYDSGYEAGALVKWKFVTLGYALIEKKADAVVASFTDSDTNGGGTDNRGSRINLQFQVAKNMSFSLIHHMAKRGIDTTPKDFRSTFAELMASF